MMTIRSRGSLILLGLILLYAVFIGCSGSTTPDVSVRARLAEWRKGVWMAANGTYTIYTDSHYFVLSFGGDSSNPNTYVGASQLAYHNRGTARKQILRIRQPNGAPMSYYLGNGFADDHTEPPMVIDSMLFKPGVCNFKGGILYDAVTEVTDTSILLSTCNGDKEMIYSNGVSVYLPAGGGEAYSYRVERIK
jgi:hypothetical protein